ncbi:MAG: methyltransferase domain-containing protein [Nanoarchaeota archaeon]|nr:methyltransferase domain-containing protein [Nanoarchaeota archaeon]
MEKAIAKAEVLLKQGIPKEKIAAALNIPEEACEIAAARLRNEKIQKTSHKNLYMALNDLRFATNETAANYRAKRLKCDTIIEIGSGIGLQSIALAKTCKKVYAIEIDKRKHEYAVKNANLLGINNIEFIHGDALKVINQIKKADIVFCETEREAEEKERSIKSIKPDIMKVIKEYGKISKDICIEVPPQIQEVQLDCEREYLSVNHELNRLNLYFGKLKKCEISAVIAETGERLENEGKKLKESKPLSYLYESDGAVKKAGIEIPLKGLFNCNEYLTSEKKLSSVFFKAVFEIKAKCKGIRNIFSALKKAGCGKVILRIKISPEKYWEERKKYESELEGKETCHLFSSKDEMLVCKKIEEKD